jgi:hypothetical protein
MASTFSQIKSGLDVIGQKIRAERASLVTVKGQATAIEANLNQLGSDYTSLIQDINAAAVASPNDTAVKNAKAEADLLVSEFQALRTIATATKNAANV